MTTTPAIRPAPSLDDLHLTAITYQRVSTAEQASKGGRSEGFSIPAQRQANQRKADDLGTTVVEEFVDPGYSGRTLNRPDLQRMFAYIKTHQVTYCIVHKLDRLARDRLVDLEIQRHLIEAGLTLVSVTESIDETPSGTLVHGVMSAISEFYSKNLAAEVTKGLTQKIATGGTPGRAPLGYLNVRKLTEDGHEYRTVEVDPERAPLIQWAFATYAAGDTSVERILTDLTARGLTTVATPKRPSGPVSKSGFFKLLRNPYYLGQIRYNGAVYDGNHPPIVETEVWERVQRLLDVRARANVRLRKHEHPLKGILYCATCKSRLHLDFARNKQGIRYAYFVCSGRTSKRTTCTRKAVPVGIAEQLVATCYERIDIDEATFTALAEQVDAAFDERLASRSQELAELTSTRKRLQAESEKLLAAHFADAIDLDTLKRHQDRIRAGLADIDRKLENDHEQYTGQKKYLASALQLLTYCATMYRQSDDEAKRLANQAFFEKIYIGEDEQAVAELAEPFNELAPDTLAHVGGSSKSTTVEVARQCSNLAPTLQRVACEQRAIRRRPRSAAVSPDLEQRLPLPVPRLTEMMLDEAERRYKGGEILRLIAGDLGVSRQRLAEHLRSRGMRLRGEKPSSEEVREMRLRYERGESLARIGARIGRNATTVRVNLLRAGVALRDSHGRER